MSKVLSFNLLGKHYDWLDLRRIDNSTFVDRKGRLTLHCNTEVAESSDLSYIAIDGLTVRIDAVMSLFQLWSLIKSLNHIWDVVDREALYEKGDLLNQ